MSGTSSQRNQRQSRSRRHIRSASGQVSAEYLGVLVLVAMIVIGLLSSGVAGGLSRGLRSAVCRIGHTACVELSATSATDTRARIDAIHKAWMAEQATYRYVNGRQSPEWTAYKRYSDTCLSAEASCRAAAVLALGGTLEDARLTLAAWCNPRHQEGCDSGAVVRDQLTEAILIDIPASFVAAGIVKFAAERVIFTFGKAAADLAPTATRAIGTTVADSTLPRLTGTFAESFAGGEYSEVTFHAGDTFYRSEAWAAKRPGQFLGLENVDNADQAEAFYNLLKWNNPREVLRTYELTEDVTMYYGRVEGGAGFQAMIPDSIHPPDVLRLIGEKAL